MTPDLTQTKQFLTLLAEGEPVTFQTFDDNKEREREDLAGHWTGTLEQSASELTRRNSQGAGVFVMVNAGDGKGRKAKHVVRVRAVFVDLDGAPLEPVLSCGLEPHIVVESSLGKWHAYWSVTGLRREQFAAVQIAIAARFGGDPKVHDLPRVMRLPGFWHQKNEPFQTRIVHSHPMQPYTVEQVLAEFLPSGGERETAAQTPSGGTELIREGGQTGRNNTLISLAGRMRAGGMSHAAIEAALLAENAARCSPPLSEKEVREIARSAARYEPRAQEPHTDYGNAERLVRRVGEDLRYCPQYHKWFKWTGGLWLTDEDGAVMRCAKDTVRAMYQEAAQLDDTRSRQALAAWARKSESKERLGAMIELAKTEGGIPVHNAELDRDPWVLSVLNGVVDLRTGRLRPARREDLHTRAARVIFDEAARCTRWVQFLDEAFEGNTQVISFLQRAVGYTLTAQTGEHCLFFMFGSGRNGKSTFAETIMGLLGDYAQKAPMQMLLAKTTDGVPNDLARLPGARFVVCSEVEEGRRLSESTVKDLTGGDRISARFMRAEWFDFVPTHKLWIYGNHKPQIKGTDEAIWSRVHLIPFRVFLPLERRDPALPQKLRAEAPGILNWAAEGCLAWQREGLRPPTEVTAATEDYRAEMDSFGDFIRDCCVTRQGVQVKASELHRAYQRWAREMNAEELSQVALAARLRERGFDKHQMAKGIFYQGLGLREDRIEAPI